ncbi:MAG TPA: hypothetical protein VN901_03685 [Candidatus Acidoferrales bacterium]|nr:hypothetical protein [Candidatus Acidoferrales bacterium]
MRDYLTRALGVKSLIMTTADHGHTSSGYPLLLATSSFDTNDGHTYWQHDWENKIKAPMVNDPFNSTVVELSRTPVAGKPYTVSEVNNPFPSDWASEGIPILAAYGDFQDWDAIIWYTFEPKASPDWKPYIGDAFDISLDPVKMSQLAAGALMFLRADVSPANSTVLRSYARDQVFDRWNTSRVSNRWMVRQGLLLRHPRPKIQLSPIPISWHGTTHRQWPGS